MSKVLQRVWKKRISPSRLALAINITFAVANGALLLPQAAYAAASAAPIHFSVQAGSLEQGLLTIARQSQQTISFNPTLVAPYQAKPVDGNFTLEQAIVHQLQGTPLSVTTTANGTLTIDAVTTAMPTAAASDLQAAKDSGQTLPTITVFGSADQSEDATVYNPSMSSSATRTNLSLQETAQSVQVVSRKLLDDRQAVSVEDALRNAGGVTMQGGNRGINSINIRGFNVTGGSTDGVSNPNSTVNGSATGYSSIDGIERVEVLKGPQAVLAGNSSPAGSVNVVRKAPTADPLHTYKFEVSKYGEVKNAIDLGGPLNDDKTFLYRLNASTMRADNSFPDFNGKRGEYVAPVLGWVTDSTNFKVGAEFNTGRASGPAGTLYTNGRIQRLPEYRLGDKDNHFAYNSKTAYYELNQDLSDNWSFNSKATYLDYTMNYRIHETYGASANGGLVTHELGNRQDLNAISLQNDIRGKFDTGPLTHNILIGYDYQHSKTSSWDLYSSRIFTTANYNDPDSLSFPDIPDPNFKSYKLTQVQKGLILQDQIDFWEKLHLQLSFKRAEWTSESTAYYSATRFNTSFSDETKWIPSYGVSYDITPEITVYANLLNSFATSGTVNTRTGEQLPPSTGKSKEAGLKFNLLDDNLTITTAVFHIVQKNVVITDITGNAVGAEGRETKGFDFDLNGQILPGWNLSASYTFAQPKDADNSEITGYKSRVTAQPKHSGSIWTTYELQEGRLQGLGAGVGIEAASDTWNGSPNNYFKMGGWAQTDASVFYRQPKYTVTLGVKNIFDRDLYYYSTSVNYIGVKPGRTARLSVTYSF
ncbi:TonB-dependent siderophore receptor [Gibbsiella quercinecans]|uniref:TonB-dependent siderophore receptor n=1 Tax=Gibbsiella quercinecans TaxID=929813 RepID=UPI000EF24CA5|nr:TonB-dependent receptor [Gibbsiella quercinecans]RLM10571.1 TonB-dependent siderophore receptor [Gibbsiella quercinecans]